MTTSAMAVKKESRTSRWGECIGAQGRNWWVLQSSSSHNFWSQTDLETGASGSFAFKLQGRLFKKNSRSIQEPLSKEKEPESRSASFSAADHAEWFMMGEPKKQHTSMNQRTRSQHQAWFLWELVGLESSSTTTIDQSELTSKPRSSPSIITSLSSLQTYQEEPDHSTRNPPPKSRTKKLLTWALLTSSSATASRTPPAAHGSSCYTRRHWQNFSIPFKESR